MKNKKKPNPFCLIGFAYIKTQFNTIKENAGNIKLGNDIEFLHKTRVATRRLETLYEIFSVCLKNKKHKELVANTHKLTKQLGPARDLDVQIEFLRSYVNNLASNTHVGGIKRLILRKTQRRIRLQNKIEKELRNFKLQQYKRLINENLKGNHESNKFTASEKESIVKNHNLYPKIEKLISKILTYSSSITDPKKIKELHELRILIKKLRYSLEILLPLFGNEFIERLQSVKEQQDLLGKIHDCDVWIDYLPKFIQKEKSKTIEYYGNHQPFYSIKKGIDKLLRDKKVEREELYNNFIGLWEKLLKEKFWENFLKVTSINKTQSQIL